MLLDDIDYSPSSPLKQKVMQRLQQFSYLLIGAGLVFGTFITIFLVKEWQDGKLLYLLTSRSNIVMIHYPLSLATCLLLAGGRLKMVLGKKNHLIPKALNWLVLFWIMVMLFPVFYGISN